MKTVKIVAVVTLAVLVAALLIASAYAYTGGRIGTPTNSASQASSYQGSLGGMMSGSGMMNGGGMMRGFAGPYQSGEPANATVTPSNQYPNAGLGCRGMMSRIG